MSTVKRFESTRRENGRNFVSPRRGRTVGPKKEDIPDVRWDDKDPTIFYTRSTDPHQRPYEIVNVIAPNLLGEPIPKWKSLPPRKIRKRIRDEEEFYQEAF